MTITAMHSQTILERRMTTARKILIIDDDEDLRESLTEQLALHEEFDTMEAGSAAQGIELSRTEHIDLVLLDVGLPDMDGRECCKILRRNGFKSPVVMLTGQDSDSDTILGLESGANDYVTKPFRFAVLLARVRAQLRQHEQSEDAVFTIGDYTFRPSAKTLIDDKWIENPPYGKRNLNSEISLPLRRESGHPGCAFA